MNPKRLEEIIAKGCKIEDVGEGEFRERVVSKLLEVLGYDVDNDVDYEVEKSIGANNSIKMDYVVRSGQEHFVLDAKAPRVNMRNSYDQIISYLRVSKTDYGILYNGKSLLVFHKDSDEPVYEWKCGSNIEIFKSLMKENFPDLLHGILSREANRIKLKKYLDNSENIKLIKSSVIRKISESTGLPDDYVSTNIGVNIDFKPLTPGNSWSKPEMENHGIIAPDHTVQSSNRSTRKIPISVTINGEREKISKSNEILIKTAEWLISQGKLTNENVPFSSGPKRWLINTEPIHKNNRNFFNSHRLSNGLFLETHCSSEQAEKLAMALMKHCGYNRDSIKVEWRN